MTNDIVTDQDKVIISLFDYSGTWSQPWRDAGYKVIQIDIQLGQDILDTVQAALELHYEGFKAYGVLIAAPCTDFASSGARHWKKKIGQPAPYDGKLEEIFEDRLDYFTTLVYTSLFIVELFNPEFWTLENPVGRIHQLVPELGEKKLVFQPWEYGDPWTKKTCLWGEFNNQLEKTPVEPLQGSMAYRTSSRNKNKRTQTPPGFARAFFEANKKGCL
jgi:hypothetical protein